MRTAFLKWAAVVEALGGSAPMNNPLKDGLRPDNAACAIRLDRFHAAREPAVAGS